jgi:hypothetical protein
MVDSGFAVIRFAVAKNRSKLLMEVVNPRKEKFRDKATYIRLVIPDDPLRYEDLSEVGRWAVQIMLENGVGMFSQFVTYQFEVKAASQENVSAVLCVPENREFIPVEIASEIVDHAECIGGCV